MWTGAGAVVLALSGGASGPEGGVETPSFRASARYTLRYTRLSPLPLAEYDPFDASAVRQRDRLEHRLRLGASHELGAGLGLLAEVDFPTGLVAGHVTAFVSRTEEPTSEQRPLGLAPRALYLQWRGAGLTVLAGHQPWHWGMGLVANDGAHPRPFGEPEGATIVERLAASWRPGGPRSRVTLEAASDVVFADREARLLDDEAAVQGVLSAVVGDERTRLGLLGVYRRQDHDHSKTAGDFGEDIEAITLDVAGRLSAPVPGHALEAFAEVEVAHRRGDVTVRRVTEPSFSVEESIRGTGAVIALGVESPKGASLPRAFVLEWGFTSGDARPDDGTQTRFTLDPNHQVGLLLFREVLRWRTARAADETRSLNFTAEPPPGSFRLPTAGGVAGATYLYPRVQLSPARSLRTDLAVLLAQATTDMVDVVRLANDGSPSSYDGGRPAGRHLGVELVLGIEATVLRRPVAVRVGGEGAVLFPGPAFEDATGQSLRTQSALVGKLSADWEGTQ